ncbi:heavy metal-associated isoprenylated plant protein 45-like [Impatiens glandulifera]|uniref:heavy metal-associated isoprenylated plant protein 45-like n=1 Tax=Impatiens glandulifera TaxID=253017 RepID=UPI001FB0EBE4|nr:heavy metal-associated isoprenylated plant protein 45-like [Impatiens glandulifera]
MTIVEMQVQIDCPGCKRKIKKALNKLYGVESIDIDMDKQKVTVTGIADQEQVLKAVRKKVRSGAELWPYPYNPEYHDFMQRYYGGQEISYNNNNINDDIDDPNYKPPPYTALIDENSSYMFSDDNVKSCSIM